MSLEAALILGRKFMQAVSVLDLSRRVDRVKIEGAIISLRRIAFFSSELTFTLEEIAAKKEPDPEIISYFANAYMKFPSYRSDDLRYIDVTIFETSPTLTIDDLHLMSYIKMGKLDTRHHIRDFFYEYQKASTEEKMEFAKRAKAVLAKIKSFNRSLAKLEKVLRAAQKGTPSLP